jgi:hypothetical protein
MASPTQMHNVLCRSVTIEVRFTASSRSSGSHRDLEVRFTASSRSSGSHRDWTDLYRASNSRVRGALWNALYVQDAKGLCVSITRVCFADTRGRLAVKGNLAKISNEVCLTFPEWYQGIENDNPGMKPGWLDVGNFVG